MCRTMVMPLLLKYNADLIIVTICILLIVGLVTWDLSGTGYYVRHRHYHDWLGRCYSDHGYWFRELPNGTMVFILRMGQNNFKAYCNETGIKRYWQMLKRNAK